MKTTQTTPVLLLAALFTIGFQYTARAHYHPGLQRWINRDPLREPGFEVLRWNAPPQETRELPQMLRGTLERPHSQRSSGSVRWGGDDLFIFVQNEPLSYVDAFGLSRCPCTMAAPVPDTSPQCDNYGGATYPGTAISLRCFCTCAGNSAWSQQVRGCLACAFGDHMDTVAAHKMCYSAAGGIGQGPILTLLWCVQACNQRSPTPP
jgi:hypothetical protein